MFANFFYKLKDAGIPVSPTAFLTLHQALSKGLVASLSDFYTSARAILVKSERYFDLYDQIFAHHFKGAELPDTEGMELDEAARAMLDSWLKNPAEMARALGISEKTLAKLSPNELIEYFKDRLREQKEAHHGGSKWIGTGGTSPVGHSGHHPGGMRVGGVSKNKSAVKVAMDRRYKDYSLQGPLTSAMVGEALKRLRNMTPSGPRDEVNIDKTIYETMKNAGEIEIVFDQRLKDKLKVVLAIDNGGWSMDPYISIVQTIFDYARNQFREMKTVFFHNTIYDTVWEDTARRRKPKRVSDFARQDPQTRFVIVGDASMAPWELLARDGSIHIEDKSGQPSIESLKFIARTFSHCVWLNPVSAPAWQYTASIDMIREIFPMYELSIDGLEKAVESLMKK
ncbi:MAG: hypothetical protein JRH15_10780 [Deltaproteobacteria bacterium]|nr:hypothetical protein [Deltaproteobacteria bacterium]